MINCIPLKTLAPHCHENRSPVPNRHNNIKINSFRCSIGWEQMKEQQMITSESKWLTNAKIFSKRREVKTAQPTAPGPSCRPSEQPSTNRGWAWEQLISWSPRSRWADPEADWGGQVTEPPKTFNYKNSQVPFLWENPGVWVLEEILNSHFWLLLCSKRSGSTHPTLPR